MIKKTNLALIILIPVTLLLLIYLTSTTRSVTLVSEKEDNRNIVLDENLKKNIVDPEVLESGYKVQTNLILSSFVDLVNNVEILNPDSVGSTKAAIGELKEKLTDLTVPEKFKDLHLSLVLVFSNMERYLEDGDENKNIEIKNSIKKSIEDNGWLNS